MRGKALIALILMFMLLSACGGKPSENQGGGVDMPSEDNSQQVDNPASTDIIEESETVSTPEPTQEIDNHDLEYIKQIGVDIIGESGVCGDKLEWYYDNGVLVIRGTGEMFDNMTVPTGDSYNKHYAYTGDWEKFQDKVEVVYIEGASTIGDKAFYKFEKLDMVILDDSITKIGESAFQDCTALEEIKIPAETIQLFEACFSGCTNLKSVEFNEKLRGINADAFKECSNLQNITLPSQLEGIGRAAFCKCDLQSVEIPDTVKTIDSFAFEKNYNLSSVKLSANLTFIPNGLLRDTAITEVTIPDSVTQIGGYVFVNTPIKELVIPYNVNHIENVLDGCTTIEKVTFEGPAPYYIITSCSEGENFLGISRSINPVSIYYKEEYNDVCMMREGKRDSSYDGFRVRTRELKNDGKADNMEFITY